MSPRCCGDGGQARDPRRDQHERRAGHLLERHRARRPRPSRRASSGPTTRPAERSGRLVADRLGAVVVVGAALRAPAAPRSEQHEESTECRSQPHQPVNVLAAWRRRRYWTVVGMPVSRRPAGARAVPRPPSDRRGHRGLHLPRRCPRFGRRRPGFCRRRTLARPGAAHRRFDGDVGPLERARHHVRTERRPGRRRSRSRRCPCARAAAKDAGPARARDLELDDGPFGDLGERLLLAAARARRSRRSSRSAP